MSTLSTNPFLQLIPAKPPEPDVTLVWASVVSVALLQIQLDAEDDPLIAPPSTLVQVNAGDRVYVAIVKRRATIVGRAGGVIIPKPSAIYDSGVVKLTPASPWNGSTSEGVHIARYGAMVHLSAVVQSSASTSGQTTILAIPNGYRPGAVVYATSYAGTANLQVSTGGTFSCWTPVDSGTTVRWSTSWYTDDDEPN